MRTGVVDWFNDPEKTFMLHGGGMVLTITSLVRKLEVSVNMILMFHSILKTRVYLGATLGSMM